MAAVYSSWMVVLKSDNLVTLDHQSRMVLSALFLYRAEMNPKRRICRPSDEICRRLAHVPNVLRQAETRHLFSLVVWFLVLIFVEPGALRGAGLVERRRQGTPINNGTTISQKVYNLRPNK
jgi:hypothetical protein